MFEDFVLLTGVFMSYDKQDGKLKTNLKLNRLIEKLFLLISSLLTVHRTLQLSGFSIISYFHIFHPVYERQSTAEQDRKELKTLSKSEISRTEN